MQDGHSRGSNSIIKATYDGARCHVLHRGKISENFVVQFVYLGSMASVEGGTELESILSSWLRSGLPQKHLAQSNKGGVRAPRETMLGVEAHLR